MHFFETVSSNISLFTIFRYSGDVIGLTDRMYPTRWQLIQSCHMRPKVDIVFGVDVPDLDDVLLTLLGPNTRGYLTPTDWKNLKCVDSGYNEMISLLAERVRDIDFAPLKLPRVDYDTEKVISEERMDMAAACMIHYGGEAASVVRFCGGEFIAAHKKPAEILAALEEHIERDDYDQIDRILNQGCPAKFVKFFSKDNKKKMMLRGNCRSVDENQAIVTKTMNKEDRNSHLITMPGILCRFSPYYHTTLVKQ